MLRRSARLHHTGGLHFPHGLHFFGASESGIGALFPCRNSQPELWYFVPFRVMYTTGSVPVGGPRGPSAAGASP